MTIGVFVVDDRYMVIEGIRHQIMPNSTHYVPFEQPNQLNQLILEFLDIR
ncbi:alpha/beta fold hydrolase [Pedobacter sp. ASV12]|nr:alpha/beta hydrolase [Pedobacter sp. ASV12]